MVHSGKYISLPGLVLAGLLLCTWFVPAVFAKETKGYAPINGLKIYYEIHGEGKPIVLLHGAFMSMHSAFDSLMPVLAKKRKVITLDMQGHGRTGDIDRPYSVISYADDIAELMKYLKITKTDILGYSMGGSVALQTTIRHPELIDKLIILSCPFKFEGWAADSRSFFPNITAEMFEPTPIKKDYDKLAPDPKHFKEWVSRMAKAISIPYDYTSDAAKINSPMLVILGDCDGITPEHAAEISRMLIGAKNGDMLGPQKNRFAILPGTPHTGVILQTKWLLSMIEPFINESGKQLHMQVR